MEEEGAERDERSGRRSCRLQDRVRPRTDAALHRHRIPLQLLHFLQQLGQQSTVAPRLQDLPVDREPPHLHQPPEPLLPGGPDAQPARHLALLRGLQLHVSPPAPGALHVRPLGFAPPQGEALHAAAAVCLPVRAAPLTVQRRTAHPGAAAGGVLAPSPRLSRVQGVSRLRLIVH